MILPQFMSAFPHFICFTQCPNDFQRFMQSSSDFLVKIDVNLSCPDMKSFTNLFKSWRATSYYTKHWTMAAPIGEIKSKLNLAL